MTNEFKEKTVERNHECFTHVTVLTKLLIAIVVLTALLL